MQLAETGLAPIQLDWLEPPRVVLVGASRRPGSVGRSVYDNLSCPGRPFELHTVNPHPLGEPGEGHFAGVSDIPQGPGLAVVAIPAAHVAAALRELGAKGIRLAVVISAGLGRQSEAGRAMLEAARQEGIRLIGPNCLGLILPRHALNASFARAMPKAGDLVLLSQSGAIATAMLEWAAPRGIGFSAVVSVGDMAQTDIGELVALFARDPGTRAILLYIEGLADGSGFLEAARAASGSKPVIALKAGRSREAGRAALSHTGALAGSWDVYRAAFRKAGVVAVDTLDDMLGAASLLHLHPEGSGDRLAILTNGGGAGILAVDALARTGGHLAQLSPGTIEALDRACPAGWSRGNPIDIIGDADAVRYESAIRAVLEDEGVDALLVMNCPTGLIEPGEAARASAAATARARRTGREIPVLACWLGDANLAASAPVLQDAGLPVFATPSQAVAGFAALVETRGAKGRRARRDPAPALLDETADAREVLAGIRADGRAILSEIEAKRLLQSFGIPVVPTHFIASLDEAEAACREINAPYALKIVSPDITHKSDFGGVVLGLSDAAAVERAGKAMRAHLARAFPEARIEGFALQPMIARKSAHELFIGIARDPAFGPVVMFGAGGTAIEVVADKAAGLPPIGPEDARDMIGATRIARLLSGYRHVPAADLGAIAGVIEGVSRLAVALPEISELDINPLLADAGGAIALDARVVLG
ncbi:acetate--CoA ligase family protein [Erythrobacter sp.]|jgi:acetyltransferase|uniref:acetate--CoA ligase family protein n=1 Tax=Erythrobacter sp. TaxID=1042 RepID=UPI002EBD3917|nr:acetate--CoA ligase family protein [Erythrobacter sp.]